MRTGLFVRLVVSTALAAGVCLAEPVSAGEDAVLPPTQSAAERIVDEYNEVNARNNATLDIEGQGEVEGPPIRVIDDATFREYRGRGETTLADEFTVDDVRVWVPEQDSYPLRFLVLEHLTPADGGQSSQQLLVFAKAGSDAAWKVTFAASLVPGTTVPRIEEDRNGLATIVDGDRARSLRVRPTKLAQKLARLWERAATGVPVAKPFEPGLLTTDAVAVFISELERLPIDQARVEFDFRGTEIQPECFGTTRRGALCFFVVEYDATLDPVSGRFVQPPTREPLTGLVPPGEYGAVTFERTAIVLAAVPERSPLARVDVIGFYNGLIEVDTSPPGVDAPSDAV